MKSNLESKNTNKLSKEEMFMKYKNLAIREAEKIQMNTYGFNEDKRQIALMELWKCIDRYDSSKNDFIPYALKCINFKINEALFENITSIKRANTTVCRTASYIIKNKDKTSNEILSELKNIDWYNLDDSSFFIIYEKCVGKKDLEVEGKEDYLNLSEDNSGIIDDKLYYEYLVDRIKSYLENHFTSNNRKIYMEWLNNKINDKKVTFDELGKKYNITKQRCNKIINDINERLRTDWDKIK